MEDNTKKIFDDLKILQNISPTTWDLFHEINSRIIPFDKYNKRSFLIIYFNRNSFKDFVIKNHGIDLPILANEVETNGNKFYYASINDILDRKVLCGREFTDVIFTG